MKELAAEKMTTLLQELAVKLGTTAEHLWGVLLKQAPISGIVDLILILCFVSAWVTVFNIVQKNYRNWEDVQKFAAWLVGGVISIYIVTFVLFKTEGIVTAFLNPEYWALSEILSKLK